MKCSLVVAACVISGCSITGTLAQTTSPRLHNLVVARRSTGYLGVGVADVDDDRARALKLKDAHGVELKAVEQDGPAAKAGLKETDVVLEFNGQRVEGMEQFVRMVRETPPNRKVTLLISRGGVNQTVTVSMAAPPPQTFGNNFSIEVPSAPDVTIPPMPPMPPVAPRIRIPDIPRAVLSWQSGSVGIEAESLNPQLAEYFGVKDGVLVRSVAKNSPAERSGLKAGDVVMRVNGNTVTTPHEISSQLRSGQNKTSAVFAVMRNHRELTLDVKPASSWPSEDVEEQ